MKTCYLTTKDNPFDPSTDFASWFRYDMDKGYSTCCLLARVAQYTNEMCELEIDRETEAAIDRIILNDPVDLYRKVVAEE